MTLRRRLLVTAIVLGCGVAAFQPWMRYRIEYRLSRLLGSNVEIGSSKISLMDGTIALQDLTIYPGTELLGNRSEPIRVSHAALRFDWYTAMFRNLQVENVVASGIQWKLLDPDCSSVPQANAIELNASLIPNRSNRLELNSQAEHNVDTILQPIRRLMADLATKQSQTHSDISSRLRMIEDRLSEASPSNANVNPLRQSLAVDGVKKELALIRQAIAEDRLSRKESDKTIASLKQQSMTSFREQIQNTSHSFRSDVTNQAKQIANASVAKLWNDTRPVALALSQLVSGLNTDDPRPDSTPTRSLQSLPDRFTCIQTGKLKGSIDFGSSPTGSNGYPFELQLADLTSSSDESNTPPHVRLTVQHPNNHPTLQGLIGVARMSTIPQSKTKQAEITVERKHSIGGFSVVKIQQADRGWASTIALPIDLCINQASSTETLNRSPAEQDYVNARLVGTSAPAQGNASLQSLIIELEPSSLSALEARLVKANEAEVVKSMMGLESKGTEQLRSELLRVSSRWEQLSDENGRIHAQWDASVDELTTQLKQIESSSKRTTRSTTNSR
jgi:hypothetical protein